MGAPFKGSVLRTQARRRQDLPLKAEEGERLLHFYEPPAAGVIVDHCTVQVDFSGWQRRFFYDTFYFSQPPLAGYEVEERKVHVARGEVDPVLPLVVSESFDEALGILVRKENYPHGLVHLRLLFRRDFMIVWAVVNELCQCIYTTTLEPILAKISETDEPAASRRKAAACLEEKLPYLLKEKIGARKIKK